MERVAWALAMAVEDRPIPEGTLTPSESRVLEAMVNDLKKHRGAGIVLAGAAQSLRVHEYVQRINDGLENTTPGGPVEYIDPVLMRSETQKDHDPVASLRTLCEEMRDGQVIALFILGGNPVYSAPADLNFGEVLKAFSKAANPDESFQNFSLHLGLHDDETAWLCQCHVPQSHYLESWSDIRGIDGTATVIQPLIQPLYDSRSIHEMLAVLQGEESDGRETIRETWRRMRGDDDFDHFWNRTLEKGIVEGSAFPTKRLQPVADSEALGPPDASGAKQSDADSGIHILFRPDLNVWDGRFSNVSWQQELPRPFTKLTWDNAALISPALADRLGLSRGDVVELQLDGRSVEAPVLILPGQSDEAVTVHLGYGRRRMGNVANGVGFDAYALRASGSLWSAPGLRLRTTGRRHAFVTTQHHYLIDADPARRAGSRAVHEWSGEKGDPFRSLMNRNLLRVATLEQFRRDAHFVEEMEPAVHDHPLSLYPGYAYDKHKWGMAVDLNTCIGCNACTVACQAENNIPVVGKEQVAVEREMHWIRVDSYFEGDPSDPRVYHQPVPCMHCENAPCEVVCPVAATVHDSEGLNLMVYNRCVGTRYCSNNCPYKVRRFNFLQFSDSDPLARMQKNPNVTVRSRGVMEKCTYCIQRINLARIEAEKENRPLRDGEIVTACQQVCPTQAIVFGDLNDPASRVVEHKRSPLNYGLLTELTTNPRTTYMARLRNPHPDLEKEGA
jgi:molybdopterin-containing oxidoreductase family iron-sulfur binding subunit